MCVCMFVCMHACVQECKGAKVECSVMSVYGSACVHLYDLGTLSSRRQSFALLPDHTWSLYNCGFIGTSVILVRVLVLWPVSLISPTVAIVKLDTPFTVVHGFDVRNSISVSDHFST